MIPKDKLEVIREINNKLTEETTLGIEEAFYSKMVIRDVNNYLAVYTDSTKEKEHIKLKGDLEIDKEYHKDPSMRIVPLALKEYFVYKLDKSEETIAKCIPKGKIIKEYVCKNHHNLNKGNPFMQVIQTGENYVLGLPYVID